MDTRILALRAAALGFLALSVTLTGCEMSIDPVRQSGPPDAEAEGAKAEAPADVTEVRLVAPDLDEQAASEAALRQAERQRPDLLPASPDAADEEGRATAPPRPPLPTVPQSPTDLPNGR